MKSTKLSFGKSIPNRSDMDEQAVRILAEIGDQRLVQHWNTLNADQKRHLYDQLQKIDLPTLRLQQQLVHAPQISKRDIHPFTHYSRAGNAKDKQAGLEIIAKGQAGCLIIAGGQGTRLRIDGPKGKCQVSKVRKKSLFQLVAEKTIAAGKQVGRTLPIAIMTSPLNHEETVSFFRENAFFGLDQSQVSFFQQGTLPLLDKNGGLFLETQDSLAEGPDGNGGALHSFVECGLWNDWHAKGVRYLNFVLIDNPLADPFDAQLFGYQQRIDSDVVIKCIERTDPEESVGVIVEENGKAAVVEYTELSDEERSALTPEGSFRHRLANLSLFSFSMEFVQKAAQIQPMLHKALKAVKFWDEKGHTVQAQQLMAWKFEKFIFDLLPLAVNTSALVYPRDSCFAPLKNFSGKDSFETVADALEKRDQEVFSLVTGIECRLTPFEISQDFYYPTQELLHRWKGAVITKQGYIENKSLKAKI